MKSVQASDVVCYAGLVVAFIGIVLIRQIAWPMSSVHGNQVDTGIPSFA